MKENKEITVGCPICHRPILEGEKIYACENHDCNFKIAKNILGAEITPKDINDLVLEKGTETKKMTSSKGNEFEATLKLKPNLTELEFIFETTNKTNKKIGICPKCGKDVIAIDGKFGKYYKCEGCDFKISGKIAGKALTDAQISQLLTDRETKFIKGFISNKGNKFDAKIVLTDDNKTEFRFE